MTCAHCGRELNSSTVHRFEAEGQRPVDYCRRHCPRCKPLAATTSPNGAHP